MAETLTSGDSSLWVQSDGPNTAPMYIGCASLGDVDIPEGDITLIYCPDETKAGAFKVVGSIRGAGDAPSFSLEETMSDTLSEMEKIDPAFPFTMFAHKVRTGRRDNFSNYLRSQAFVNTKITSRGSTNIAARDPDETDASLNTYDLEAEAVIKVTAQAISRQAISEVNNVDSIVFVGDARPRTATTPARKSCQIGYASCAAGAGVTANVLKTTDSGGTWTAAAADPFGIDEDCGDIVGLDLGADQFRVVVSRAETDAGAAAEVAYSDDSGATWTAVDVGVVTGQYVTSLSAYDLRNVFVGTDDGYIYKSDDSGVTWTVQDAGVVTTGVINDIHFSSATDGWMGGASNALARSIDGGVAWEAITGPQAGQDITAVTCLDRNRAWVGYGNGNIYSTADAGVTWTQRTFSGSGTGSIAQMAFRNEILGYMIHTTGGGNSVVLRTVTGGFYWEPITVPTNTGLTDLFICDDRKFFVCGNAQASTGFIASGDAS